MRIDSRIFPVKKIPSLLVGFILLVSNLLYAQSPIPDSAVLKKVAGGFQFTEGPLWMSNGSLLFSDIPANTIYDWKPGKGVKVFLRPSGHSNGIVLMDNGTLLIAQKDGTISRIIRDKKNRTIADEFNGKKFNVPNDLIGRSDGSIYFSDPSFGMKQGHPVNGIYRIAKDSKIHLLTSKVSSPNGLVFSPNGKKLYVNDSKTNNVWVFDVRQDGSLYNGKIFAEMRDNSTTFGSADGMKVDSHGNVFTTGPGGIWIYSPGGTLLDRISTPEYASNLAFGGKDYKTLFITATHDIYSIRVKFMGDH